MFPPHILFRALLSCIVDSAKKKKQEWCSIPNSSIFSSLQCILTRSDYDVFFFGESVALDLPQAFTCPLCGSHGFTEATLQEHVAAEHSGKPSLTKLARGGAMATRPMSLLVDRRNEAVRKAHAAPCCPRKNGFLTDRPTGGNTYRSSDALLRFLKKAMFVCSESGSVMYTCNY